MNLSKTIKVSLASGFSTVALLFALAACGESKEWRKEVHQSVEKLQKSVDVAAQAVPGERYMRIITDANDPTDPERQKKAQEFAKQLLKIDVSEPYEATVWFGFDSSHPLRADIFRSGFGGAIAVQERVAKRAFNASPVKNAVTPPDSEDDVVRAAKSKIEDATKCLAQSPVYITGGRQSDWFLKPTEIQNFKAYLQSAVELAIRGSHQTFDQERLVLLWSGIDDRSLLYIVMPEEDWAAQEKGGGS